MLDRPSFKRASLVFDPAEYRRPIANGNRGVALALASAGMHVFPVGPDKKPLVRWRDVSTDSFEQIDRWWKQFPKALVGIDCGKSGLIIVDADRHPGAPDGVAALHGITGDFRAIGCPIVETAGGGLHLYFRMPDGERLTNSRGALPAGIDIRGNGGYVLAAGSTRQDGTGWRSMEDSPDLAEMFEAGAIPVLPNALSRLIRTRPERVERLQHQEPEEHQDQATSCANGPRPCTGERERAYATNALDANVNDLAAMAQGSRNETLNAAAYRSGRMVAAGWIDRDAVERALEDAACACGLVRDDGIAQARKTIKSGIEAGMTKPMEPLPEREFGGDTETSARAEERLALGHDRAGRTSDSTQADQPGTQADPLAGVKFAGDEEPTPLNYQVDGLFCRQELVLLVGPSGGGKSFAMVDFAVAMATSGKFFDKQCRERCGVVILAAEGAGTLNLRVAAIQSEKLEGEVPPLAWIADVPDLAKPSGVQAIIPRLRAIDARFREQHGARIGVVFIDTMMAACGIVDENSNGEAGAVIRNLRKIIAELDATVVAIHHTGKNQDAGTRGASAYRGGADSILTISAFRDEKTGHVSDRRIALTKSRTGAEGWNSEFTLRFVKLGEDVDGNAFGSCVIEPGQSADQAEAVKVRRKKLSGAAKMFIDSLSSVMGEDGKPIYPFGAGELQVRGVDLESVRREFYARKSATGDEKTKQDTKLKAFTRGQQDADTAGRIAGREIDGIYYVWLTRGDV